MKRHQTIICVTLALSSLLSFACKSSAEQKKLDVKLCHASFSGELDEIKKLLAQGADPNTTQCGEFAKVGFPTPLFFALLGYDKSVQDLHAGNKMLDTRKNEMQYLAVRALLAAGANPNAKSKTKAGETPLMLAEYLKSSRFVSALTEGGADPNMSDAQGRTAKDYGEFTDEPLKDMAGDLAVVRYVISLAYFNQRYLEVEQLEKELRMTNDEVERLKKSLA